jgi:hypothetical protein
MIFRAGKYPQGEWPKERVQKLVDAYDPEKNIEAPVVIGHRAWGNDEQSERAHGWVKSLRMDGAGKVYADITDFSSEVRHAIADKQYRYVSAEIYEFDKHDASQAPYLRAVALLGRSTPAVLGTRIPAMFEELLKGGTVTTLQDEELIAVFTRKVSTADRLSVTEQPEPTKEEPSMAGNEEHLKAELAAKETELSTYKKELEALRLAGKKQDAETYFGKLRDEGKLPPALFERAVGIDVRMDGEGQKEFRSFFEQAAPVMDLSGNHRADKKNAQAPAASEAALAARIRAFQAERNLSSFEVAAKVLKVEQPALFEGVTG